MGCSFLGNIVHMLPQAVADLWCSNISSYIEFPLHTVHNDVQMQLAHALNDSLVGFVVPGEVEGGVLLGQLIQRSSHLVIVCFALGLNGNLQRQSLTQPLGQGHKTGNSRRVPQQVEGEHPVAVMGNVPGIFKNKFTNCVHQLCTSQQRNHCGSNLACYLLSVHCKHCACCSVSADTC